MFPKRSGRIGVFPARHVGLSLGFHLGGSVAAVVRRRETTHRAPGDQRIRANYRRTRAIRPNRGKQV